MSDYFLTKDDCSAREIFPGVTVYAAACRHMMLSYVELEPHSVVERHAHPHEQVGILIEGTLEFTIGDETRELGPGDMWRIPGGVAHHVRAGDTPTVALDIFHPVRDEYLQS